jgi:hypothetical protein
MRALGPKPRSTVLLWSVTATLLAWPIRASNDALSCVKELPAPIAYSTIYSRIPAIVHLSVEIGDHGKARQVTYDTNSELIKVQLDAYFREKAKYLDSCKGRSISFTVEYRVVAPELDFPVSEVTLLPPDGFLVVCHRLRPALDPVRPRLSK